MNPQRKAVACAVMVVGLMAGGNVSAAPFSYAAAYNDVFNWSITNDQGNAVPVLGPIYTSEAHAELKGAIISTGGIGMDAPIANLGTAANPNNSFIKIDRNNPDYSWGDAVIWNPSHATNMGEVYLEKKKPLKTGGGGGLNSQNGTLQLNAPTTLTFSFSAAPYLEVQTTGNILPKDWARADLNFSIAVTDAQGNTVFDWSPDGLANNAPLAIDLVDSADLNHDLFANTLIPGPMWYGCQGQGQMGAGPMMGNVLACDFLAMSVQPLAAGLYNLSVTMEEHAHASIPEPGSVLLLGSGLWGLAMGRRRLVRRA